MKGYPITTYRQFVTAKLRKENEDQATELRALRAAVTRLDAEADFLFRELIEVELEAGLLRGERDEYRAVVQRLEAERVEDAARLAKAEEQKRQQAEYHERALAVLRRAFTGKDETLPAVKDEPPAEWELQLLAEGHYEVDPFEIVLAEN